MSYDKFVVYDLKHYHKSLGAFAIPVLGWFAAIVCFSIVIPIRYLMFSKRLDAEDMEDVQ